MSIDFQDSSAFLMLIRGSQPRSPELGRRYLLKKEEGFYLGNQSDANLTLPVLSPNPICVSIFYKGKQWFVNNKYYIDHTALNGIPFRMGFLKEGDILEVGPYAFEFCLGKGIKAEFYEAIYDAIQIDFLTKAYSRGYIMTLLQWEIDKYSQHHDNKRRSALNLPMSLFMLDVDHFGKFNKDYGHITGDNVLKHVIDRVKSRVRSTDVVSRYGGEEFIVYLPNTALVEAKAIAEMVRKKIEEEPFLVESHPNPFPVTVSIGVSLYQSGMGVLDFINDANKKMLFAKTAGRNQVVG